MFSVLTNKLSPSDLKNAVENNRQTRPFEIVRVASGNIKLTVGYKGNTILKDSYYFTNGYLDGYIAPSPGDRILLYGQIDPIQNGIWDVMSIVSGYVNIQRPSDYAKNTPIRSGQCVLIAEGQTLTGYIYKNNTPEYDSNQNKIISYNGTSPQTWEQYRKIFTLIHLRPIYVTIYNYSNYQGTYANITLFNDPMFGFWGGSNSIYNYGLDGMNSIRIPPGYKVTLYEGQGFSGKSIELTADCPGLEIYDFFYRTNSIAVQLLGTDPINFPH